MIVQDETAPEAFNEATPIVSPPRAWFLLGTLVIGYIGIYLCRKNFAVANPLIQEALHLKKERIGIVASYSTVAYMIGKFVFGPIIDRFGGRVAFLLSLFGVALFGALGGLVNSLAMLTLVYSLNRLAGSAGWAAMIKQVPNWFPSKLMAFVIGVLSLGFVFGGVCSMVFAGRIAKWSGDDWRWVMSGPSIVLFVILLLCWAVLPREASARPKQPGTNDTAARLSFLDRFSEIARVRQFWILCGLSFTLTLLRETFNTWTVDFFKSTAGPTMKTNIASLLSTPFDGFGAAGIVLLGWIFGRIGHATRSWLLFFILALLAVLIFLLPSLAVKSTLLATLAIGGIGFLAYGPYSLPAGIMAVEIKGKAYVATVSGTVDGVGYLAGILAGAQFGQLLDVGGYRLGFNCLAALAAFAAVLCLFLYERRPAAQ